MKKSVILSACRTPIGSFLGAFKTLRAPELGSIALKGAIAKAGVDPDDIDEVIMGCVLTAGMGQAPARQASIGAGLSPRISALTINRVCSSGLKAVMLADLAIRAGDAAVVASGGMESMSNAPHCIRGVRDGLRMGDDTMVDTMIYDGLWDVFTNQHMGKCAELCAKEYLFRRLDQDEYAKMSYERALAALSSDTFKEEIIPVEITNKKREVTTVDTDEEPARVIFEKIPKLKPSFTEDGTITPANASSISDGAAALIITSESYAVEHHLKPLVRIIAHASYSDLPEWFTTAPIGAIRAVLNKANITSSDIDLWEINEAFPCVPMAAIKEFNLDSDRVNIHGGAIALGHPIGCSGARILTTLIHSMQKQGLKRGLGAICNGGGEATAIIVERV